MNKEQLIDYLYQEMHASERSEFEADREKVRLAKSLSEVRSFLKSDLDEDPKNSPIFIKPRRKIVLSKWWAIAASLLILLMAGRLFDVRVVKTANALTLSYGEVVESSVESQPSYEELLASVATLRQDLNAKMDGLQTVALKTSNQPMANNNQQESVAALKRILEKENSLFAEELTQQLQTSQQAYTLEVINTLLDYWDGQRKQDLEVVNTNLRNLAQTIQLNSDEFAQFTNQSLQNY